MKVATTREPTLDEKLVGTRVIVVRDTDDAFVSDAAQDVFLGPWEVKHEHPPTLDGEQPYVSLLRPWDKGTGGYTIVRRSDILVVEYSHAC